MKPFFYALALTGLTAGSAPAGGMIEKACIRAGREAASQSLCACIQQVANQTLNRRDQRLAASFFKDPHKAQVIRQSDRRSHEDFWQRYKTFGAEAEDFCAGA